MSSCHPHRARGAATPLALLAVLLGAGLFGQESGPPNQDEPTRFIRLVPGPRGVPKALETAIVRYAGKTADGRELQVDLVSVIHIADRQYYEQLNREFTQYDAVLYELVGPRDAAPQRGEAGIYGPVASLLDLSDQLAVIDYRRKNFVHADMTGEEFLRSMEERQESFVKMFFRMMGQAIVEQSKGGGASDADLLLALFSPDRPTALKRVLAQQLGSNIDHQFSWMVGPEGSTLITERNKVALRVLRQQIDAGKSRLAIFYGGGHMPDIERRLTDEFAVRKVGQRWLVAWDLSPRNGSGAPMNDTPEKPKRPRKQRAQPQPAAAP